LTHLGHKGSGYPVFGFGKSKKESAVEQHDAVDQSTPATKKTLFGRLKQGLARTGAILNTDVRELVSLQRQIDDDLLEELETQLLVADMGVDATTAIISDLTQRVSRKQLKDGEALMAALRENMMEQLIPVSKPLEIDTSHSPYVILVVGINGAGKTTTIGKLAKRFQLEGHKVMLASGDTFRAAAVEQLQVWGERNDIQVIAQQSGADSASVIYDGIAAAKGRGCDILLADTAGRLHTQVGLMDELKKVVRVIKKVDESAPHEVLLVLDAGTGQNAVNQAEQFQQAVGVSGIALTKLDGTAKGGVIFAIAKRMGLPIRFIGVGEGIDDLRSFNAADFVDALFDIDRLNEGGKE
jgi:fused signal recognition particle receptor